MIKLIGVFIVVIGFALNINPIATIILAALVTALTGGIGIDGLFNTLGTAFVSNRSMCIFIAIMVLTGTLERNGLKAAATKLISKVKNSTAGLVIGAYGVMRVFFAAFNVSFGGAAGFVRPVVMPMAIGAIEASGKTPNEDHVEALKGMGAGMENITWFFGQVLFVGGAGAILVQTTLDGLGYKAELLDLASVELPVAIFATLVAIVYYFITDRNLRKKYYVAETKQYAKEAK
ncbi:MAG: DUF969 family protein [Clostridiaceae bacterium]|nr:DUF969 domain-containing protein [Eubacteriales bacterium]